MSLHAVRRPAVSYDLLGLASLGLVTVGREREAALQLDCLEIPNLLSRKHARLATQPDGKLLLTDLGSTNGTYVARQGLPLRKLEPNTHWELREGDTISFGGPEVISAHGANVPNPFIFRFYASYEQPHGGALQSAGSMPQQQGPNDLEADQRATVAIPRRQSDGTSTSAPAIGTLRRSERQAAAAARADQAQQRSDPAARGSSTPANAPQQQQQQQQEQCRASDPTQCSPSGVMKSILATHLSCPICQDWLVACHALTCGHMFCGACLVTWLNQNQTCPSCREAIAGVPVRCFQVDSTINDLMASDQGVTVMSPLTRNERRQKQDHWDHVAPTVVPDWAVSLNKRKQEAAEAAARNNRGWGGTAAQPVRGPAVLPSHRLSEHGSGAPFRTD